MALINLKEASDRIQGLHVSGPQPYNLKYKPLYSDKELDINADDFAGHLRDLRGRDLLRYNETVNDLRDRAAKGEIDAANLYIAARSRGVFNEGNAGQTALAVGERSFGVFRDFSRLIALGFDKVGLDKFAEDIRRDADVTDRATNPALQSDFSRAGRTGVEIGSKVSLGLNIAALATGGGAVKSAAKLGGLAATKVAPKAAARLTGAAAQQAIKTPKLARFARYTARESAYEVPYFAKDLAISQSPGAQGFSPALSGALFGAELAILGPLGVVFRAALKTLGDPGVDAIKRVVGDLPDNAKRQLEVDYSRLSAAGKGNDVGEVVKAISKHSDNLSQENRVFLAKLEGKIDQADEQFQRIKRPETSEVRPVAPKGLAPDEQSRFDELSSLSKYSKLSKEETAELHKLRRKKFGEGLPKEERLNIDDLENIDELNRVYSGETARQALKESKELDHVDRLIDERAAKAAAETPQPKPPAKAPATKKTEAVSKPEKPKTKPQKPLKSEKPKAVKPIKGAASKLFKGKDQFTTSRARVVSSDDIRVDLIRSPHGSVDFKTRMPEGYTYEIRVAKGKGIKTADGASIHNLSFSSEKEAVDTITNAIKTTKPSPKKQAKSKLTAEETKRISDGRAKVLASSRKRLDEIDEIGPADEASYNVIKQPVAAMGKGKRPQKAKKPVPKKPVPKKEVPVAKAIEQTKKQVKQTAKAKPKTKPKTQQGRERAKAEAAPPTSQEIVADEIVDSVSPPPPPTKAPTPATPAGGKPRRRTPIDTAKGKVPVDKSRYKPVTQREVGKVADQLMAKEGKKSIIKGLTEGRDFSEGTGFSPNGFREVLTQVGINRWVDSGAMTIKEAAELDRLISPDITGAAQTLATRRHLTTPTTQATGSWGKARNILDGVPDADPSVKGLADSLRKDIDAELDKLQADIDRGRKLQEKARRIYDPKVTVAEGELDINKILAKRQARASKIKSLGKIDDKYLDPNGRASLDGAKAHYKELGQDKIVKSIRSFEKTLADINAGFKAKKTPIELNVHYDANGRPTMTLLPTEEFGSIDEFGKLLGKTFKGLDQVKLAGELDKIDVLSNLRGPRDKAEDSLLENTADQITSVNKIEMAAEEARWLDKLADGSIDNKQYKKQVKRIRNDYKAYEKIIHIAKNNMLSAPSTAILANVSTAINVLGGEVNRRILGLVGHALWNTSSKHQPPGLKGLGFYHIPKETYRQFKGATDAAHGIPDDARIGWKHFFNRLTTGKLPSDSSFYDARPAQFKNRWVSAMTNFGYQMVSYLDPKARRIFGYDETSQILMGKLMKATGGDYQKSLELLPAAARSQSEILDKADRAAINYYSRTASFSQDNFVTGVGSYLQRTFIDKLGPIGSAGSVASHIAVPFRRAPVNVVFKMFGRSPVLGAAGNLALMGTKLARATDPSEIAAIKRHAAREISWQMESIPMALAGWLAMDKGLINLNYPTDRDEQKLWEEEGRIPFSIKIPGIDTYISARFLYPALFPVFAGSLIHEAGNQVDPENQLGIGERLGLATAEFFKSALEDIPSLQFMENFVTNRKTGTDETKDLIYNAREAIFSSAVGATVPNLLAKIAQASDPYKRELYYDDWQASLSSKFFSKVPGLRTNLAIEAGDITGEDVERGAGKGPIAAFATLLLGSSVSRVRNEDNPLVKEVRRLFDTTDKFGDNYSVSPTYRSTKEYPELSDEKVKEVNMEVAKETAVHFDRVMNSPLYARATDEDKQKELRKQASRVAKLVWAPYAEHRRKYDPDEPPAGLTRADIAFGQGTPQGYFADYWTPQQEIDYIDQRIESGELRGYARFTAEVDRAKYQIQEQYYQQGKKNIYEMYHKGTSNKKLLYRYLINSFDKATVHELVAEMAGYENQLIYAGARSSRSFTNDDGTIKDFDSLFGLSSAKFGKKMRSIRLAIPKLKVRRRQGFTIDDILKMLR